MNDVEKEFIEYNRKMAIQILETTIAQCNKRIVLLKTAKGMGDIQEIMAGKRDK